METDNPYDTGLIAGGYADSVVAPQPPEPVAVHSCNRLGRQATPPRPVVQFTDWVRAALRRR
jgi:hypothetical protein